MDNAILFQSGRSHAVRLPKAHRFEGAEVVLRFFGNGVLLLPVNKLWVMVKSALVAFQSGFQISH